MPTGIPVLQPLRRRAAAALAAVAVVAAGLTITLGQNAVASTAAAGSRWVPAAVAAPVTTTAGGVSLTVDPAGGLSAAGASLKVTGKGFKTANGLYVAICHADGKAPASLQDCVGGAIPTSNTSNSWAHITPGASDPGSTGPAVPTWGPGGSFSVTLVLPASDAASDALDCSKVACAVYTKADTGADQSQSLSVALAYVAVTTSSSTPTLASTPASSISSSSAPATSSSVTVSSLPVVTSTIGNVPTTVEPKTIRSASLRAGGAQEVLFAGFTKGENVAVTLDRTALAAVRADNDGIVDIKFTVPAGTPAGTHLLRVVGQSSRTTGVASFVVTAAPATTTVASSSPSSSAVASSTPVVSSAPVSSAVIVPPAPSSVQSSVSPLPTSSAPAPIVASPSASSGSRPVWPWYVLGVVVLLWVGFALFMLQRRRSRLAAEMREKERILAEAAAAEHARAADAIARANSDAPTAYLGLPATDPPTGYDGYHPGEHGLLSGRDNPDNPGLLSGQRYRPDITGDRPTTYLTPESAGSGQLPTTYLPPESAGSGQSLTTLPGAAGPAGGPAGPPDAGPPTGAWTPDFTSAPPAGPEPAGPSAAVPEPDSGPATAQWRLPPDDGDDASGGENGGGSPHGDGPGPEPRGSGGRHSR